MRPANGAAERSGRKAGLFLAFEGVEGAGKSTQVRLLADYLRGRGAAVVVAREPGSTPLGERIREAALGDVTLEVPPKGELFLMLAARAAFVDQVVRPALEAGATVIADRFELSTLAYQGAGRGLPLERVRDCNRFATGGLSPDATLLLDVEPEVGAGRHEQAGKSFDRLEREGAEFHARVARGYRELAPAIPGLLVVDARGSAGEVHRRIVELLAARFPETFAGAGFTKEQLSGSPPGVPFPQAGPEVE